MDIQKVTQIYNGEEVECAKITADKVVSWRFKNVLDRAGDYAWQCIIKAEETAGVVLQVGDKATAFNVATEFNRFTYIFTDVNIDEHPYVDITFPIGTYYIYHTQLEHGQVATDWNENNVDINDFIQNIYTVATQTADKFNWLVSSGTSSTNFTLTDRTAELVAQYINLHGLVTFSGLDSTAKHYYFVCASSANADVKVVTTDTFPTPYEGLTITVKFANANTANSPALLIATDDDTYLYGIYAYGSALTARSAYNWKASSVVDFVFDGCNWNIVDVQAGEIAKNIYTNGTTTINGGKITTGSITAEKISVTDLKALNALIGGWNIGDDGLYKTIETYVYPEEEDREAVKAYVLGTGTLTDEQKAWFDYSNTGDVGTNDLLAVRQLSSGYRTIEELMAIDMFKNYQIPVFNVTVKLNPFDTDRAITLICSAYGRTIERYFGLRESKTGGLSEDLMLKKTDGVIGTYDSSSNPYYFWNEKNLVGGKNILASIAAHTGNGFSVDLPTAQIGTNPAVVATTRNSNVRCYISTIMTIGTNTRVVLTAVNESSSSVTNVEVDYIIIKGN